MQPQEPHAQPRQPTERTQPGTDAPGVPVDHPSPPTTPPAPPTREEVIAAGYAPETADRIVAAFSTAEEPVAADVVPPPQFGGATADQRLEAAAAAKNDPGYVSAFPLLTTGAFGAPVALLAELLEEAGYPNAIAAGIEQPMLTDELMRHVRAFQDANGIDPSGPQRGVDGTGHASAPLIRKDHEGLVEAMTWAALHDAAGRDAQLAVTTRYPEGSFA